VSAVKIGARQRHACVALVEPGLIVRPRTPAPRMLSDRSGCPSLRALCRGLFLRLATDLQLEPPLSRLARRQRSLTGAKLLLSLPLACDFWPLEESAKRCVRDVVVRGERPQRLVGRPGAG
jgi:hypothetical protein